MEQKQGGPQLHHDRKIVEGRRLPVGAEVLAKGGVHFRVWASGCQRVSVVIEASLDSGADDLSIALTPEGNGYFAAVVPSAGAGMCYRYRLDDSETLYPDPASRYQPHGPHGPSQVIDPNAFQWTDKAWPGVQLEGQVIYEMHLGTFTREGTWEAARHELRELADAGITMLEIMPVAEFVGRYGWGYDGVDLFAPSRLYGLPDDCRRFVDCAHALGLGVVLDVVYNHVGPDGNYLAHFSPEYFTDRYSTDWGAAINFDGEHAGPVREFFLANAGYWIDEFHFDGLRLDATQDMYDQSPVHILAEIVRQVRQTSRGRSTLLVAENEPQHTRLVRSPAQGGYGLDALWNDDFHHSAMVALTGHNEAYYTDYRGTPQEFVSALKRGYLYQGQWYKWQRQRRGTPTCGLKPATFVTFIQNHDQIANSGSGLRCHQLTSPGRYRAMTALMLLAPGTPMLFQGQEFGASSPFYFFADHDQPLAAQVRRGRAEFLSQFPRIACPEIQARLPDPADPRTFECSKLDLSERQQHAETYNLHRDLLKLRRQDPALRSQRPGGIDGAVLGPEAFVARFFTDDGLDRLLLVNFGRDLHLDPAPEPLLAPPEHTSWETLWSSENPRYGGSGTPPLETEDNWRIPGEAAVVLSPKPLEDTSHG
ncbi:MAG TPA: malto-oligosyltrehalose trehalohydrolase [Candidatus Tectomicrobia bacterium]|nr:malto-oligosyltrehalose trehalohydrolase [Candidatus Tectomicrobia bacterium]